jgi:predicted transglutaminase-like cysteine proteinase
MSDLGHALRAVAQFAIGLGVGLLACIDHSQADDFDARFFDPYPALQIASVPFQLASLTPFEIPQDVPTYTPPSQPFGAEISGLVNGGLQNKWRAVKKRLPREHAVLERCQAHLAACPPAAKRLLAILEKARMQDGWARIAELNRAINLNIRPVDDLAQYGVVDLWATPLMAFKSNVGDCEDYAIAKYVALHEIGFADDDLRLLIVHLRTTNEDHAVAAVRYNGQWLILDNRTLDIRQDVNAVEFDPLFVVDVEGVKRITTLAAKPENPWANISPAAVNLQLSSGWKSAPLLL